MATRHQARTAVVGLLYAYDLGNENIAKFSDEILEEGKIRNKQREFSNRSGKKMYCRRTHPPIDSGA